MRLREIQSQMFEVVRTPLTSQETTRRKTVSGRETRDIANAIIRPNDRLSSHERLEIYNRQYWFRLIGALTEDFEGLRTIVGAVRFEQLAIQYLSDCPSRSFTLRNLGSRLPEWLAEHPEYTGRHHDAAVEMARLEWAEVQAFDGSSLPELSPEAAGSLNPNPKLLLQPYIQLLEFSFPVDELLLSIRRKDQPNSASSNSASTHLVRHVVAKRPQLRRKREPIYLAVHRHEFSVYFKRLEAAEYQLLQSIRSGCRLSKAIDDVDWGNTDFEAAIAAIQKWFANWASLGWLALADKTPRKRR